MSQFYYTHMDNEAFWGRGFGLPAGEFCGCPRTPAPEPSLSMCVHVTISAKSVTFSESCKIREAENVCIEKRKVALMEFL